MKTGSIFAGLFGPLASSKASREYQEALQSAMPEQEYLQRNQQLNPSLFSEQTRNTEQ